MVSITVADLETLVYHGRNSFPPETKGETTQTRYQRGS